MKFIPKPSLPPPESNVELPAHVIKIKAYIGGLKQTDYFWYMLGAVELTGGLLLVSQYLSLLGATLLMPVTLNIFLFHFFLKPHETGEVLLTLFYLMGNALIIFWYYPKLKSIFLNFKSIY